MTRVPAFAVPVSASVTAGVALWVSRASFDLAGTTAAPIRVAMLPSLAELAGFITLSLLIAAGLASLVRSSTSFWEPATDALLPLFALSLLVLPYLPWLADWVPVLRLFAGPGRLLIWIVVLGQVLWVFLPLVVQRRAFRAPVVAPSRAAGLFGILSVALSAPFVLNVRALPTVFADLFSAVRQVSPAVLPRLPAGALGVLFDQEYGIFAYAPVLLLAVVGIAGMLRERSHRWLALCLGAASAVLITLAASVDPWWTRSMMPGRPVFLSLPLLAAPIAWLYARLEPKSASRAGAQVLLLASVAVTVTLVAFNARVPALQEGDGSSALLQWMSPTWQLWREAPTYVAGASSAASLRVVLWLLAFSAAVAVLTRRSTASAGRSALAATTVAAVAAASAATMSAAIVPDAAKRFDVEGRVMFPLLETFDPIARPIAVRYDGFALVQPHDLPQLFAASAVPGQRTDRQPVRVILNARFRLPAGRYVLDLKGSEAAAAVPEGAIALQLGREGRPIESWPVALGRGRRMQQEFDVPLDSEFVGFRAGRPVEQGIAELRVSPRDVVEARKRAGGGTVLSAAAFEPARIFFHDSSAYPEAEGFWVKGRTSARMTLMKVRDTDPGLVLAVHSGARPNVVTLETRGWSHKLELVPGITQRVTVPSTVGERFVPLTITSTDGFVPAEIESSRDRRLLGAWVAFIRDDTARTSEAP